MQELLIEKIRTDGGVQSRERIHDEYVGELAELLKSGRRLPPVDVYNDGREIWMADGFHRLLAHTRAEKRSIKCNVHKGSKTDAVWASCGANQEHGLRRSKGDVERAVKLAVALKPALTQEAIALHVGCTREYVNRLCSAQHLKRPATVTGKDGKSYRVPPPPTGDHLVNSSQGETPTNQQNGGIPPPPSAPARTTGPHPPPPEPAAEVRLDAVKKPIPEHLVALFDRGGEVQDLLSQISRIKGVLKRAEESGDVLFGDCHFQSALASLQTAFDAISATKPYAVCPWCRGNFSETCAGCGHRGVLGKYRWDVTVQKELKV